MSQKVLSDALITFCHAFFKYPNLKPIVANGNKQFLRDIIIYYKNIGLL